MEIIECLRSIVAQSQPLGEILLIDSSPDDSLYFLLETYKDTLPNVLLRRIHPSEFDHGGSRNIGLCKFAGQAEYVLFLTQDVVLGPDCLKALLSFAEQNTLSGVYARQLPRRNASFIEVLEREYNYKPLSYVVSGIPTSIDDVFFSNVCALYKVDDLLSIGGLVTETPSLEDSLTGIKFLKCNFKIGYCSDAIAYHSHEPRLTRVFKRYFDIGATHQMHKLDFRSLKTRSKGYDFVRFALKKVLNTAQFSYIILNLVAKFLGFAFGKRYRLFPTCIILRLTANSSYWRRNTESPHHN